MGMSELYRKGREQRQAARDDYHRRLHSVKLEPLEDIKYDGSSIPYRPQSPEAWLLHRELLRREKRLDRASENEIRDRLRWYEIYEHMKRVLDRAEKWGDISSAIKGDLPVKADYLKTVLGRDELHLIAMRELGYSRTPEYKNRLHDLATKKRNHGRTAEDMYRQRPME